MSQAELIKRIIHNDRFVFKEIVEQWQDMVFNTAISIVQNEEDADDITQEVFATMYERIKDFREESTLSTWIYRITVHRALDHEKKKKREKNGGLLRRIFTLKEEDEPVTFDHPGVLLDRKEKAAILFGALKKLPEKQRIAFTLYKIEGLSYHEIAAVMNTSLYAVESLQARAKTRLAKILKKYYEQHL